MNEKGKAVLAYIFGWLGGVIVLYAMSDSQRNTRMHAAQSIVISVGNILATVAYSIISTILWRASYTRIPFLSTAIYAIYLILIIIGIVKAVKEQDPELPVVGGIAMNIFGKKINEAPQYNNFNNQQQNNVYPQPMDQNMNQQPMMNQSQGQQVMNQSQVQQPVNNSQNPQNQEHL